MYGLAKATKMAGIGLKSNYDSKIQYLLRKNYVKLDLISGKSYL